jgi:hypothetical protein
MRWKMETTLTNDLYYYIFSKGTGRRILHRKIDIYDIDKDMISQIEDYEIRYPKYYKEEKLDEGIIIIKLAAGKGKQASQIAKRLIDGKSNSD